MMGMVNSAAEFGYFATSIDWRVPDGIDIKWPDQLMDAENSIAWLTKDLSKSSMWSSKNPCNINPNKIGAVGFSSGGMIAMMLGFNGYAKVVASIVGPTNIDTIYHYISNNEKEDENDLDRLSLLFRIDVLNFTSNLL